MKKYVLGVSLAALMVAGNVYAADVVQTYEAPEVAPVAVAPAFSWDGFYIGGQLGGSWADSDVHSRFSATASGLNSGHLMRLSPDPDGFVGGLYAGYNFDLGNDVIIGLETDFVWGDVDDQTGYKTVNTAWTAIPGFNTLTMRASVDQKWAGATRVRAGYAMDRFLPYLAAGVAYGKVKVSGDGVARNAAGTVVQTFRRVSESDTYTGWTLGTGVDYAATDNILLRLEYRYSDYGDESYNYNVTGAGQVKFKVDHKTNDVRVGVAYKF